MRYHLQVSTVAPTSEMEAHNVPPAHEQGKRSLQDSQQHDIKHDNYYKIDSSWAYKCPRIIIATIRGHMAHHYIISSSGRQNTSEYGQNANGPKGLAKNDGAHPADRRNPTAETTERSRRPPPLAGSPQSTCP